VRNQIEQEVAMRSWVLLVLAAPFVGSFLGVLIRRIPLGQPVAFARSTCAGCNSRLAARDLIPIVSYVLLRGRCRLCGASIGSFHPVVEFAALGGVVWAALAGATGAQLWANCLLGWCLLVLSWIDAEHLRLPDILTLPLLLCGLSVTFLLQPDRLTAHAAGALAGYLAFQAIALGYRKLRGREGLGAGDAKLLGVAGAWVGIAALPIIVLIGACAGLLYAAFRYAGGGTITRVTELPFGPWLALGLWLQRLYGNGP
jgi:leader peptidase (prepilin peptidase)/N-methyltransferase